MQILPVLDLMGGQIVRGIGGRRDEYRPIASPLAADAQPTTVAAAFQRLGLETHYLADLDAIRGALPAWDVYRELMSQGVTLWVDAGISTLDRARELAEFKHQGRRLAAIVAGLESLRSPEMLDALVRIIGAERLVFSLDLKSGRPLVSEANSAWRNLTPLQIATCALRYGVRRMIVLDLAAVGEGRGVGTQPLCRSLRAMFPNDANLQLIAGGGVRGPDDLVSLERAGANAALVASALHDGRLIVGQAVGLTG